MNEKYNIVCLSNQLWLKDFWTNKSHVMSRLSKLGHKVVFVEPPINTGNIFFRQLLSGAWSVKRLLSKTKVESSSGVLIYSPLNIIPEAEVTSKLHISHIKEITKKYFDPNRKTILWIYHVQLKNLSDYIEGIAHNILIYDCVDNYLGFPESNSLLSTTVSKKVLAVQEETLARKADLVFATAPGLVDRLGGFNQETYFTPNVGDYEKFKDAKKIKDLPIDLKNIKKPIIGFYGALDDYKFDAVLFKKLAESYPELSFVLIGSLALKGKGAARDGLGIGTLTNVHLLGAKPYEDIHRYAAGFDAFIIPLQLNDYTIGGCFPVKFHEALAAGLPVVVTDLPAYAPFSEVCYISRSYQDFIANVGKALLEDSAAKIKARQEVAQRNNWDGKVANMLKLIENNSSDSL